MFKAAMQAAALFNDCKVHRVIASYISPGLEDDLSEYLPQWHESPGVLCHPMPKDSDISKIVQKLKQDHNLANVNPVFGSWY